MPNSFNFNGDASNYINLIVVNSTSSRIEQTIECWVKTDLKEEQTIIQGIGQGYGQPRWSINGTTHNFYWVEAKQTITSKSGPDIADGQWHHIALTYEIDFNIGGMVSFYTDGKLIEKIPILYSGHLGKSLQNVQLQFGAAYGSATSFKGYATNLRIWDSIKTSDEIKNNLTKVVSKAQGLIASFPLLDLKNPKNTVNNEGVDFANSSGITVDFEPGQCINAIAELKYYVPKKPFIIYKGDEEKAYLFIQSGLMLVDDIRSYYKDSDKDFNSLFTDLKLMKKQEGISQKAWDSVKKQLIFEFQAVSDIRDSFNAQSSFIVKLETLVEAKLNSAITLTNITTTTKVKSNFMNAFLQSILSISSYAATVVKKDDPEYAAFLGIASTLYGLANISGNQQPDSDYDFEVEVAKLWEQFSNNYQKLITENSGLETSLLTDWGKMQSAENFINDQFLFWSTDNSKKLDPVISKQMKIYYYSVLIPAKWKIYNCVDYYTPFAGQEQRNPASPNKCHNLKHKPPKWAYKGSIMMIDYKGKSFPSKSLIDDLTGIKIIDKIWNGEFFGGIPYYTCSITDANQI